MTPPKTPAAGIDAEAVPGSLAVSARACASSAAAPALKTLTKRPDFLRAARARRQVTKGFVLQARKRASGEGPANTIRVGFTCSKKVGNAVARNRAKRRLREIARIGLPRHGRPGWDYVLIGRAHVTATRPHMDMVGDLAYALRRIHAPQNVPNPKNGPDS